ncbi:MAG: DUF6531 domain-containing protein [Propionibacteriaceae bacterium]|jgi:YD repeat-containing protein|nr:DUF6531 domain-containing protein [Propionibacteriaceae bacterium]
MKIRRFLSVLIATALGATCMAAGGAAPSVAAPRAVVVLDPDDNVAKVDWPTGVSYNELALNHRLATEVESQLEASCSVDVVLTRDASQDYVDREARKQAAIAADADVMVTLAFNSLYGVPWGFNAGQNGPEMYSRSQDVGFANAMLNRIQEYTGRPETRSTLRPVVTAANDPWYSEYGDLAFPWVHSETLFIDGNWDNALIEQRFDLIVDGVTAGILDQLNTLGSSCSAYPDVPSAEELGRLRNLGYQNFQSYGGDPISMSTGNFVTREATIALTGVGEQVIDTMVTYNAQSGLDSQVGHGWSFAYGTRTQFYADGSAAVFLEDGRTFIFDPDGDASWANSDPTPVLPSPDELAAVKAKGQSNFDTYGGGPVTRMPLRSGLRLNEQGESVPQWLPRDDAFGMLTAEDTSSVTWTSAAGDQTMVFAVDEETGSGRLVSITDRQGNTITLTYGDAGVLFPRLTTITDEAGQTVAVDTDENGRIIALTRPDGARWALAYDEAGDLVALTSPRGRHVTWEYDDAHRMTVATDAAGVVYLRNVYDGDGRVVEQYSSTGAKRTLVFDDAAGTTTYTDATGAVTVYHWNEFKQVTKVVDALSGETLTGYLPNSLTASETDPSGATVSYSYNDAGQVTETVDPVGSVTTTSYNESGDVTGTTYPGGEDDPTYTVGYEVDRQGLPVRMTNPDGGVVTNTYNDYGDITATTDELGNTTTFAYDERGNLVTTTNPVGEVTSYTFDLANRMTSMTTADGAVTSYTYDPDDNLTAVTHPDGATETYTFDLNNMLIGYVDQTGAATSYVYDTELNLVEITLPDGGVTRYVYDEERRLLSETDAMGGVTAYEVDPLGRTIATTNPRGFTTRTTYDPAGRVVAETDEAGFVTAYTRDPRGLVMSRTAPDGGVTTYAHDAAGRVTTETDPLGGVTRYSYDWRDQLTRVVDAAGNTGLVPMVVDFEGGAVPRLTCRL